MDEQCRLLEPVILDGKLGGAYTSLNSSLINPAARCAKSSSFPSMTEAIMRLIPFVPHCEPPRKLSIQAHINAFFTNAFIVCTPLIYIN